MKNILQGIGLFVVWCILALGPCWIINQLFEIPRGSAQIFLGMVFGFIAGIVILVNIEQFWK